jgi:hypothetical protein
MLLISGRDFDVDGPFRMNLAKSISGNPVRWRANRPRKLEWAPVVPRRMGFRKALLPPSQVGRPPRPCDSRNGDMVVTGTERCSSKARTLSVRAPIHAAGSATGGKRPPLTQGCVSRGCADTPGFEQRRVNRRVLPLSKSSLGLLPRNRLPMTTGLLTACSLRLARSCCFLFRGRRPFIQT